MNDIVVKAVAELGSALKKQGLTPAESVGELTSAIASISVLVVGPVETCRNMIAITRDVAAAAPGALEELRSDSKLYSAQVMGHG